MSRLKNQTAFVLFVLALLGLDMITAGIVLTEHVPIGMIWLVGHTMSALFIAALGWHERRYPDPR